MKQLFPLLAFCLLLITAAGCGKDDDGDGDFGELKITLSWQAASTDLDLSVLDPGLNFYFPTGTTERTENDIRISADDLSGPGEESVTWLVAPPDGVYVVNIDNLATQDVDYTIRVQADGVNRTITGTVDDDDNISFTKTGTTFTF